MKKVRISTVHASAVDHSPSQPKSADKEKRKRKEAIQREKRKFEPFPISFNNPDLKLRFTANDFEIQIDDYVKKIPVQSFARLKDLVVKAQELVQEGLIKLPQFIRSLYGLLPPQDIKKHVYTFAYRWYTQRYMACDISPNAGLDFLNEMSTINAELFDLINAANKKSEEKKDDHSPVASNHSSPKSSQQSSPRSPNKGWATGFLNNRGAGPVNDNVSPEREAKALVTRATADEERLRSRISDLQILLVTSLCRGNNSRFSAMIFLKYSPELNELMLKGCLIESRYEHRVIPWLRKTITGIDISGFSLRPMNSGKLRLYYGETPAPSRGIGMNGAEAVKVEKEDVTEDSSMPVVYSPPVRVHSPRVDSHFDRLNPKDTLIDELLDEVQTSSDELSEEVLEQIIATGFKV